ncbi:NAD(P)H-dependent flavin oxidoreductase [Tuberibacillus sp. Marseille-P3662]|uniref:NAD(P)H-dependent flavin oxidoreductase n=1 Tax=Tuberibacillus sp. Marseille-P3662 TaxID=1965358 RepID=UPI000A1CCD4D|nr:nitronate monooxygenase [Tuberibacillus sp. Marseille-P3662]
MECKTRLTERLGIQYPIIQGGLAYLAYSDLAAAVSEAGGLGQLTAMTCESTAALQNEIDLTRKQTHRPFGVNFAIGNQGRPYEDLLQTAIDAEVPVISITGGNPQPLLQRIQGTGIKTLVLVASKRQAVKAESLGADAVMVVGQEGGGHLGRHDIGTMVMVPSVVEAVDIPVAASGGIGDGHGLMAALALGADGVEMGTRFIATQECLAHEAYKQHILGANADETVIIKKSLGAPARALANEWTDRILSIEQNSGTYEDLKDLISGYANKRYIHDGYGEEGFGWAGQIAGRIHDIPTVQSLINRVITEAEDIRQRWV